MYVLYAGILILISRRATVLVVPAKLFVHAAGRSLGVVTRHSLISICAENGFLRGCDGGASVN